MFGYVRPQAPELKLREYQYYRGVYCGLCRAQGRCTGQCSRMTLSYDYVFLTLLRLALENGNPSADPSDRTVRFEARRCLPHPLRKRLSLRAGTVTRHIALCAAMLNFYKLCDDKQDEKPFSAAHLRATWLYLPLRHMYRRAAKQEPELAKSLKCAMEEFSRREEEEQTSADLPAAAFGEVTACLLSYGLAQREAKIARHVGMHMGKWLYFADAVDDFDEDVRKGRRNPLRGLYHGETLSPQEREAVATAMTAELMRVDDALSLLDIDADCCGSDLQPLLRHMLYIALPATTTALAAGNYHASGKPQNSAIALGGREKS